MEASSLVFAESPTVKTDAPGVPPQYAEEVAALSASFKSKYWLDVPVIFSMFEGQPLAESTSLTIISSGA